VLFSEKKAIWKIGDFGLTSEGTSKHVKTTRYSRGTDCYRAPELLKEDSPKFNNKSDIWALGCILHELAAGHKAFSNDFSVFQYALNGEKLVIGYPQSADCWITKTIHQMLEGDASKRPGASELLRKFREISSQTAQTLNSVTEGEDGPSL
jgi:serine/threonine-protein kinase Nek2